MLSSSMEQDASGQKHKYQQNARYDLRGEGIDGMGGIDLPLPLIAAHRPSRHWCCSLQLAARWCRGPQHRTMHCLTSCITAPCMHAPNWRAIHMSACNVACPACMQACMTDGMPPMHAWPATMRGAWRLQSVGETHRHPHAPESQLDHACRRCCGGDHASVQKDGSLQQLAPGPRRFVFRSCARALLIVLCHHAWRATLCH